MKEESSPTTLWSQVQPTIAGPPVTNRHDTMSIAQRAKFQSASIIMAIESQSCKLTCLIELFNHLFWRPLFRWSWSSSEIKFVAIYNL